MSKQETNTTTPFGVGTSIQIGDVVLVRTDTPDRIQSMAESKDLMSIKDPFHETHKLLAVKGEYKNGCLQVDNNNQAVGYWMPETDYRQLRVGARIKMGEAELVRTDDMEKIKACTQPGIELHIVNKDWLGYQLLAVKGDYAKGVLQVTQKNAAVGYWAPHTPQA
eukprot:NODE_5094_length_699_cov_163.036713_g4931_i0.p1 GENE.NODE_5094_length_699_cov_163.036713_g4931_i0~~NODE_5094_length_699_cov_163.036713_g4931_i0.p1  ORF type:complete len:165 (-),score=40.67 NODE_5094_length_699_cov_163.036713_g4931_i0:136-630(-)